ncbi:MAG TPA: flagellar hook basal-body protein [Desulfuromonadaceae bacterium]
MSIATAMQTGISGLAANGEAITVIGNNLANSNTIGYKTARTLFSDMLSENIGNNSQIGRGVQVQKVDNIFSQGSMENTTGVTDLAIQGDGFFSLCGPNATTGTAANAYYTRAGSFRLDSTGLGLVNPDGYKLLDTAGDAIKFAATDGVAAPNTKTFQKVTAVDSTGVMSLLYADAAGNTSTLFYAGTGATTATYANAVKIAETVVPNPAGMTKQGGTLFTLTAQSGTPAALTGPNGTSEKLLSNSLELSNVDLASELVNMLTTQRAYSANSKTITTADAMTQDTLNLVR